MIKTCDFCLFFQTNIQRILLQQKIIADETRVKIGNENAYLKDKIIKLENEIFVIKKDIQQDELRKKEILYLELSFVILR